MGKRAALEEAFSSTRVGKLTGTALYVHVTAVSSLPVLLRAYEGCARAYVGTVEGATLVKLHRVKAQVSYLAYPEFDRRAHPVLRGSLVVQLRHRQVRYLDFTQSAQSAGVAPQGPLRRCDLPTALAIPTADACRGALGPPR